MHPDDARIPHAFELADKAGLSVSFAETDLGDAHPNTAVFELEDETGLLIVVRGSSLGGGDVVVTQIDSFEVDVTGDLPVLVVGHVDRPGVIAAVTGLLAESGVNVASMQVSRARRGAAALMLIETDHEVALASAQRIAEQPGVTGVRRVPAV
jgi:L-serine dehydratase